MFKKIGILSLVMFLIVMLAAGAQEWQVEEIITLDSPTFTDVSGLGWNSTTGSGGAFFVYDFEDNQIGKFDTSGNYLSNVTPDFTGEGLFTGLWVGNRTSGNHSIVYLSQSSGSNIKVLHTNGTLIKTITTSGSGCTSQKGLTSNDTTKTPTDLFGVRFGSADSCNFDDSGTKKDSISISSYATGSEKYIDTNSSGSAISAFVIIDAGSVEMHIVTQDFILIETVDLNALGISEPTGVVIIDLNTLIDTVYILSDFDNSIYKITTLVLPSSFQNQQHNESAVAMLRQVNFSAEVQTTASSAIAILATNQTGELLNITDGRYGSPLTLKGLTSTSENADFIWTNEMFVYANLNQTVGWQISWNDTLGNENQTAISTFNATAMVLTETGTTRSVSRVSRNGYPNITITFNRSATQDLSFLLPSLIENATFQSCGWEDGFARTIQAKNWSGQTSPDETDFCNVTLLGAKINTTGPFQLKVSEKFSTIRPPNLPVAVVGSIIITILVFLAVRITRKK